MDALLHVNDAVSRLPASPSRPLSSRSTRSMSSSKQWDRIRAITLVTRTPNKENNHNGGSNGGRRKTKKTRAQAALPETYVFNVFVETLCPSITLTVLQHSNPKTWTLRLTLSNWKERLQPTAQHPKPWIAKQHCGTGPQDSITKCTKTLKLDL